MTVKELRDKLEEEYNQSEISKLKSLLAEVCNDYLVAAFDVAAERSVDFAKVAETLKEFCICLEIVSRCEKIEKELKK